MEPSEERGACANKYRGKVLAFAIEIMKRDFDLTVSDIAALSGIAKTTMHHYSHGQPVPVHVYEGVMQRLGGIRGFQPDQ